MTKKKSDFDKGAEEGAEEARRLFEKVLRSGRLRPLPEPSPSAEARPSDADLSQWLEANKPRQEPIEVHYNPKKAQADTRRQAWDQALRILQETGDLNPVGAMFYREAPDDPVLRRALYKLAAIFSSNHRMTIKLATKPVPPKKQKKWADDERIIVAMIDELEGGDTLLEDAFKTVAGNLGISISTVRHVWGDARSVPIVDDIARKSRKNRRKSR